MLEHFHQIPWPGPTGEAGRYHYGSNFSRMILPDGDELSQADVLATDQAISILENRAGAKPSGATNRTKFKEDAPFFLAVGFVRPHVPLIAPERHFAHYPDADVDVPDVPGDDLDDVPAAAIAQPAGAGRPRAGDRRSGCAHKRYDPGKDLMRRQRDA